MSDKSNHIVVGVDGSVPGGYALREAQASGSEVEAVLVWSDPWAIAGPRSLAGAGREGVAHLKETLADAVRHAVEETGADSVKVVQKVVAGHPAEALVTESASLACSSSARPG